MAPQLLTNSGGGLELQVWVGFARRTTETFPGALAAALLNNLQSSLRWLRGSVFSSLRYARTSAVLALQKSILAKAPLLEICGSVLACACIGPYMEAPLIFRSSMDVSDLSSRPLTFRTLLLSYRKNNTRGVNNRCIFRELATHSNRLRELHLSGAMPYVPACRLDAAAIARSANSLPQPFRFLLYF
jgi:hypothetical protein